MYVFQESNKYKILNQWLRTETYSIHLFGTQQAKNKNNVSVSGYSFNKKKINLGRSYEKWKSGLKNYFQEN